MNDSALAITMIILGIGSYIFLKSQGIHYGFKLKGTRMQVTKYETKTVPNPHHRSVKVKSLQHIMAYMPKKEWLSMFPPENRKLVSVLLSNPTIYIKQFLGQDFPTQETVTLETADQLLNYLSKHGEEQLVKHGEKWGEIIM